MTLPPPDPQLVEQLVYANRILYDQGVVDGLGHVSVRHPEVPGVYLLSCNRAPGLVRRADIVCYDLDGNAVSETTERPYLERFIHGEIYRARPDVVAVVHSHSPSVIPFGAVRQPLRPIFHMAGFLGAGSAHFDIRDSAGDTDMHRPVADRPEHGLVALVHRLLATDVDRHAPALRAGCTGGLTTSCRGFFPPATSPRG